MINNTPKPTGSVNNTPRVGDAETWATITTTWGSETRTWLGCSSLMNNTTFRDLYIWSTHTFPWTETTPWQLVGTSISNTPKP